jgi:beta-N-acetylhexosaminidase
MSLEEKIGQMMIMGFHGTTPSSDIKMLIQKYHIGGTVLFSRNITDPRQVARLIKARAYSRFRLELPLGPRLSFQFCHDMKIGKLTT